MPRAERPYDPWLPLDVRYEHALDCVRTGNRGFASQDRTVVKLVAFIRRLGRCRTDALLMQLRRESPDLCLAFQLHDRADLRIRSTVEARLLAAEPFDGIARKTGMSPKSVKYYAASFFDVASRLPCLDYILGQVIGHPAHARSDYERDARLLKTIGYLAGWQTLDDVFYPGSAASKSGRASAQQTLGVWITDLTRLKAVSVLQRIRADASHGAAHILQSAERSMVDEEAESSQMDVIKRHIHAMLLEMPWTVGNSDIAAVPPVIQQYDSMAAELRDDEMMLIAAGQKLPPGTEDEVGQRALSG